MGETLIVDIETNGLYDAVTKIHCICIKVKGEDHVDTYCDTADFKCNGSISSGINRLGKACLVIGHNWIDYDCRVIRKFYPDYKFIPSRIRDTLLRSYLFNPSRKKHKDCPVSKTTVDGRKSIGIHKLENWGYIVGRGKVEHEDWTKLTKEMIHRCVEDVHITDLVDDYLIREAGDWDWSQCEKIEKWFRYILSEQESYGVLVDRDHIDYCIEQLMAMISKIDKEVLPQIPLNIIGTEKPTKGLKKDGTPTTYTMKMMYPNPNTKSHMHNVSVGGDYCKVQFNQINLASNDQVKKHLLSQGWQPTEWNYKKDGKKILKDKNGEAIKTSPKITEDSLDSVEGTAGRLVARRVVVQHRLSQITGWKNSIRQDGRIGAGGNSVGTNTGRVTHRRVVNVPKEEEGIFYGKEMRSIFTVPEGKVMVGSDLSALENRIAVHYTSQFDDGSYANRILSGDPHQYIADLFGIDRSPAKNINYGIMYGAGVGKIKSMIGCSMKVAKMRYNQWWDANPALKQLKGKIHRALQKHPGYLKGIDGRKIFIRSPHSAMNALFQNAGSMVNKVATIFIYKAMKKEGLRSEFILNFHDEQEVEIHPEDVERYTEIVHESYKKAGEYFNLTVPIEGEVQVGNNWADVH